MKVAGATQRHRIASFYSSKMSNNAAMRSFQLPFWVHDEAETASICEGVA
jgi:hypothetical protein